MKTRGSSQGPLPERQPWKGDGGFTLIEVLIAMAIIGVTAVVLLDQRLAIVQDAGRARDKRTVWVLAAQKLSELELQKSLWVGLGSANNGDFSEVDPDYAPFTWEYQIVRELIDTSGPAVPKDDNATKRELYRLTLSVRAPGIDEPVVLEAEFPTTPPKTEDADPTKANPSDPSKDPQKPTDPGGTPK